MITNYRQEPVIVVRDGTVYGGFNPEAPMISNTQVGDGECNCARPRYGTLFDYVEDGERTRVVFCNVCRQHVTPPTTQES